MGIYEAVARPLLFQLDPESAHNATIELCRVAGRVGPARALARRLYSRDSAGLSVHALGTTLPNPLGLAAGFDKNGHAAPMLRSIGLGHVEIGSVSASPSSGNPRPRLFRLVSDEGIVVWYGVPNEGAQRVAETLRRAPRASALLGVNLVRTNTAAAHRGDAESVYADYVSSYRALAPHAGYVALNLSCPNTDGRDFFDDVAHLGELLSRIERDPMRVPVVLKLRPTRDSGLIREIVAIADDHELVSGFAINLPSGRPDQLRLSDPLVAHGLRGAIGGRPVEPYVNAILEKLANTIGPDSRYTLMAAGGVSTAADAYRKVRLGASLVQVYSGLIYHGPALVPALLSGLSRLLERDGFASVREAIGADVWSR